MKTIYIPKRGKYILITMEELIKLITNENQVVIIISREGNNNLISFFSGTWPGEMLKLL